MFTSRAHQYENYDTPFPMIDRSIWSLHKLIWHRNKLFFLLLRLLYILSSRWGTLLIFSSSFSARPHLPMRRPSPSPLQPIASPTSPSCLPPQLLPRHSFPPSFCSPWSRPKLYILSSRREISFIDYSSRYQQRLDCSTLRDLLCGGRRRWSNGWQWRYSRRRIFVFLWWYEWIFCSRRIFFGRFPLLKIW